MNENREAEIDRLAALQEIDRVLKERRERAAALAGEADEFEQDLKRQRDALAAMTAERDVLDARRADIENQLERLGNKIRDNRMRLNRVRNNTELLALQREIDLSKESTQQLEEELLRILELLEGLNAQIAAAQETIRQMEADAEAAVATRRAEAESLQREVAAEGSRRDALTQGMDPSLRSKYEQIFERRGGTAVVTVRDGTCLGCHMNVPPQLYNELQRYRDIRQCPNCHRILYWRPTPGEG